MKDFFYQLSYYFFNLLKFKRERFLLFSYISQGLQTGGSSKELLQSIALAYKENNQKYMLRYVEDTLYYMEEMGSSDAEAMLKADLINEIEYKSIFNISKSEPHKALDFINKKTSNENNLKWAVGMLFFPTIFILTLYVIFQPVLADMTNELLRPVNDLSIKNIDIPTYFNDRSVFGGFLALAISLMASFFIFVEVLKRKNIPLLFKLFKITEREFIINNFEIFLSLLKSGQSSMKAIELLSDNKSDFVSRKIFTEIKEGMQEGDLNIYDILNNYKIDSSTVSYIRSGENNNKLIESIEMSLNYNKIMYKKLIKKLTKILPLIGEIIMTLVILKPLIDIINVTTIGTLQFQV